MWRIAEKLLLRIVVLVLGLLVVGLEQRTPSRAEVLWLSKRWWRPRNPDCHPAAHSGHRSRNGSDGPRPSARSSAKGSVLIDPPGCV